MSPKSTTWPLAILLIAAVAGPAPARAESKLAGDWEGVLKVGAAVELRLVLHVAEDRDGALSATFASPDQVPGSDRVDSITLKDRAVTFAVKANGGRYAGTLDDAGAQIVGEWSQGPGRFPLTLRKGKVDATPAEIWEGPIKLPGGLELRFRLRVSRPEGGPIRATADSPDQGSNGLKVDSIAIDQTSFKFTMKALKVEYSGTLDAAGAEAKGDFVQNGVKSPLTLKKVAKPTEARRPQVPKRPYPYREVPVTYANEAAKITLAGTLTIPEGAGPFPAVLLITGSGPQDRDETLLGHKPFLVLADHLTRRGIAVLRVDDRGVGGSTGDTMNSTSEDFAGDALAGVAYLRSRKEVDRGKIGLIGHSEGGIVAPMAAARSGDVAFLVLMAGTGLDGEQILTMQRTLILKAAGATDDEVARQNDLAREMIAVVKDEKDPKAAAAKLKALARKAAEALPGKEREALADADAADPGVAMLNSPWFRFFLTYDPRPALAKVECPVLAINGETDLQVPPRENLAAIAEALKGGGNSHVTVLEFKGLNHLFQTSATGSPSEYGRIEETIAPAALEVISGWIKAQVGG